MINPKYTQELVEKAKIRSEALCRIMKVKDEDQIPKWAYQEKVIVQDVAMKKLNDIVSYLYEELFFENPNHKQFDGMPNDFREKIVKKVTERRINAQVKH